MTLVTIDDKNAWDKFIDSSPYGTLFHKWDFLKIIEKYTGYRLHTYATLRGEEITCAMPVFSKKTMGINMVFSPPPQTVPYLGFVMTPLYDPLKQRKKESYLNIAMDEIEAELTKLSPNYTSIITVPGFVDVRPFEWKNYDVNTDYTYVLNIEKPIEQIYNSFDRNCRESIKAVKDEPLEMKIQNDPYTLYKMMDERLVEIGLTFNRHSPEYLNDILKAYPENMKMYYLYNGENIEGIQVVCEYKKRFMLFMGNVKGHANEYLTYELIKKAKASGFKELENPDANTFRLCAYKSKFSPALQTYFSIRRMDAIGRLGMFGYSKMGKYLKNKL